VRRLGRREICSIHANYNIIRLISILDNLTSAKMLITIWFATAWKSFKAHQ
jgi:hypothetical protein